MHFYLSDNLTNSDVINGAFIESPCGESESDRFGYSGSAFDNRRQYQSCSCELGEEWNILRASSEFEFPRYGETRCPVCGVLWDYEEFTEAWLRSDIDIFRAKDDFEDRMDDGFAFGGSAEDDKVHRKAHTVVKGKARKQAPDVKARKPSEKTETRKASEKTEKTETRKCRQSCSFPGCTRRVVNSKLCIPHGAPICAFKGCYRKSCGNNLFCKKHFED